MGHGKRDRVLAVAVLFFILSWITVSLRVWVRAGLIKSFGMDDWTMVVCQIFFTAYLICQLGGVVYGTGQHLADLIPWRAETALMYWYFCEVFYLVATVLMKISIGLFLLRVATKPLHIWIIRIIMAATAVFGGAFLCVVIFQCWPIGAFWTLDPNDGHCINAEVLSALTYGISGLNVIADFTFAILPGFIVKDLQMSRRRKMLVAGILALAALASAATVVRLPFIWTLKESALGWNGDFLYDTVGVAIWTTVEVGIGISAGCLATLRPLLQLALAKFGVRSSQHATASSKLGPLPLKMRGHGQAIALDGLTPGTGVQTVITSKKDKSQHSIWRSSDSSQEHLAHPDNIRRHVVVEYEEIEVPALHGDRDRSLARSSCTLPRG